ncbi:unnamed protein product [Oncorhynchus mykiss]|uniref:Transposase Tc1-like domain-containing protein n=1 Tax=Oncorhynchus mykiss TaxID=8022 RepID=A0A060YZ59_ONCMY|nr:unnamed protein product [Oncorhynchus mykiss]
MKLGLHNQRISIQSQRSLCIHQGLDLTAVQHRNRLQWANAHLRWPLARWRSVLFTDESRFQLYRADGRQRVLRCVGERFVDVTAVNRVPHGGGGVMVWVGISYGHN